MSSKSFSVRVPGSTSNLGSGFDTVSAALTLYLDLEVRVTESDRIEWPADFDLPRSENIIEAAFVRACEFMQFRNPGVHLRVSSEIPLKRGLGSSGAAIIAGIKAAECLAERQLSVEEIFGIAYPLEHHPDNIAASLLGGWAISRVSGEEMAAEKVESRLGCRFVAAVPDAGVSTAEARRILPSSYTLEEAVFNVQRSALLVYALAQGRTDLMSEATRDRLHQDYRARLVPGLSELLNGAGLPEELSGCLLSTTISGSGSTVLALATDGFEQIGEWMCRVLQDFGVSAGFRVLDLDVRGAHIGGSFPSR